MILLHNAAFSSPSPSLGCEEELVGGHSKGDGQGEGQPREPWVSSRYTEASAFLPLPPREDQSYHDIYLVSAVG